MPQKYEICNIIQRLSILKGKCSRVVKKISIQTNKNKEYYEIGEMINILNAICCVFFF